jgi:hypothetical protein
MRGGNFRAVVQKPHPALVLEQKEKAESEKPLGWGFFLSLNCQQLASFRATG